MGEFANLERVRIGGEAFFIAFQNLRFRDAGADELGAQADRDLIAFVLQLVLLLDDLVRAGADERSDFEALFDLHS